MLLQTDGPGMILHIISLDLCHNITNSFDKICTRCKNPNKQFLIDYEKHDSFNHSLDHSILTTKTLFLISFHSKQESKSIVINI